MMKKSLIFLLSLFVLLSLTRAGIGPVKAQATREGPLDRDKPLLEVTFLDVGQGDACFIKTPEDKIILIDGGAKEKTSYLLPYLKKRIKGRGFKAFFAGAPPQIDLIVATHAHSDHIGGLNQVMEEFKVEKVIDSGEPHTTRTYEKFLKNILKQGCDYEVVKRGQTLNWGEGLEVQVLFPPKKHLKGTHSDLNNNSVVIKLTYGKISFLLTGDIEKEAEYRLISTYGQGLRSTILKVPHQGSHTSSTQGFVNLVKPEWAVISVGKNNKYGHPHQEVVERYKGTGTKVYRTDSYNTTTLVEGKRRTTHNGTITFLTDGEHYEIKTEKDLKRLARKLAMEKPRVRERPSRQININTASQAQLETLPRIGPAMAKRIIEYRPYKKISDIQKVPRIGPRTYEGLKDLICVE